MSGPSKQLLYTVLIGLVSGAILAPTAWATAGWSAPVSVSESTASQPENPVVAVDPNGNAVAVWEHYDGVARGVQTSSRPAGGSWTPAETLSPPVSADQKLPDVAIGPDGLAVAVWLCFDGSKLRVQASSRPPGGAWSAPVYLSDGEADPPHVAVGTGGFAVAGWNAWDSPSLHFRAQVAVRLGDGSWTSAENLSPPDRDATSPFLAVGAKNDAVATWTRSDLSVQVAVRPAGSAWGAPETLSLPDGGYMSSRPTMDEGGNATVIWLQYQGNAPTEVRLATRPIGGPWGAPELLASGGVADAQIAGDDKGQLIAAWTQLGVLLADVKPPGGVWQGAETLSQVGPDPFLYSLAVGANGDAVAALSSTDFSATVRPAGGSWSEPQPVPVPRSQSWLRTPVDKFGRAIAVGLASVPGSSTTTLQAAYYVPDRPPAASTDSAASVTMETATVTGSIDPNRLPTTYVFQYGPTTAYGLETDAREAGAGFGSLPVSASLAGLKAATTYHYRAVGTNDAGTRFGADKTFSTVAAPGSGSSSPIPTPSAAAQQRPDTVPPTLALTFGPKQDVLDRGAVVLLGKCDEACTLTAFGAVSAPVTSSKALRFKRVSKIVSANTQVRLRLRLSRRSLRQIRRALSRGEKLIARVVLRAADQSGNARSFRRKIKITH